MRVLHLYRPRLPGLRAQAIQVLHSCHALARRGHTVTLLADRGGGNPEPADILGEMGLGTAPGLDLRVNPHRHSGLAGMWFRRTLARWWEGPPGVVLARDKRRFAQALRRHGPAGHRLVLETHELDSALARERGVDPASDHELEAFLARRVHALVANCGGTLALWEEGHPVLPATRAVVHNATSPGRLRRAVAQPDPVIRYVGSFQTYKGLDALLAAAPLLPLPLELIGAGELGSRPEGVRVLPPVAYPAVPDLLSFSRVLVLPLADNLFGRRLTSPLKLWDYLATSVAVVAPDLPTVREVAELAGARLHMHAPGQPADLARAAREAAASRPRQPFLRSWDERAADLEAVFG